MKVVITGASGWLGRATLAILKSKFNLKSENFTAFGSTRKKISVDGLEVNIYPISQLNDIQEVNIFVHLAFRTRDKLQSTSISDYEIENRQLTEFASKFILTRKPDSVVTVSSGAVFNPPNFMNLARSLEENPYGYLKNVEEQSLKFVCDKVGAALVINRLWGLSGRDVQNPTPFALFEFIEKAFSGVPIEIRSSHEVWRRYVDARELMELCLSLAIQQKSVLFDSGGPLIEIGELARLVVKTLGSSSIILRSPSQYDGESNLYFSRSEKYEELFFTHLGRKSAELPAQILESSKFETTISRGTK